MKMSDANSQDLSTAMTVISANIEGLTASKACMLSEMCKREHCHCLCLQETHTAPYLARSKITGMTLVAERHHINYGSAILIRSDLQVKSISVWEQDSVELISIEMAGVVIHSVYTPPHIMIGDFNNHNTTWGYTNTDDNGKAVEQRADSCNLTLIHYMNLSKSFNSARWKRGYNPDFIFVSESIANMLENKSWNLSFTHNTVQYVDVHTRQLWHLQYHSEGVSSYGEQTGTHIQRNSISLLKTLNQM